MALDGMVVTVTGKHIGHEEDRYDLAGCPVGFHEEAGPDTVHSQVVDWSGGKRRTDRFGNGVRPRLERWACVSIVVPTLHPTPRVDTRVSK
jgi:hypothetical protein